MKLLSTLLVPALLLSTLTACQVSGPSSSDLVPPPPSNPPPLPNEQGKPIASNVTLSQIKDAVAVIRREIKGELFLSNGIDIGYRRASEIDAGIFGGKYCMLSGVRQDKGAVLKIKRITSGQIYTPSLTKSGMVIQFENGAKLSLIDESWSTTVGKIAQECFGEYLELRESQ